MSSLLQFMKQSAHMDIAQPIQDNFTKLYQIAESQGGYFTAKQAQSVGLSRRQLTYYASKGRFVRVGRGVYRLALFPHSPHEDLFIAWLRTGGQGVISHESALALYELSDVMPAEIHLIVPPTASRRHPGLRLHTNRLEPDDITTYNGLPVTTVPRTIAHVSAAGLADELIIQAVQEAIQRGMVTKKQMHDLAQQQGGRTQRLLHLALGEMGEA
jgi:predicted transcriptional regulator of viral defense system